MIGLLLFITFTSTNAYRFIVPNRAQECVYSEIKDIEKVIVEIGVISGGNKDIAFTVTDPSGSNIYSIVYEEGKYNNYIYVNTKTPGVYSFCFDNTMSLYTSKLVEFKLQLEQIQPATEQEVKSIKTKLQQVSTYLNDAKNDQRRLRIRENRNRQTGDATNLRTTILFLIGCFVIMAMGCFQVWYIKRQFKRGR
ncbi:hypothetical protein ENUP19_0054G0128 [Entamoeba nuttalli]|uniref:Emp24/gp25L/p24 family protein n=2 Tax=Entamoeba nuttalli TaxID=412467 RepID=K2H7J3_ENTNP|nr:emp24/gp25L/p24 family protein [Entamoeba nuttalli P19]EKE38494.1 emp24/gp25L/p24 family protein [Entamoeba nuttalli P19]|eukprot:XP_008859175.1 emp24/gp25L/p24 family protein [Entamoeba nuttalli P19]